MFYIVQENVFSDAGYEVIFDALDRLCLDYEISSLIDGELNVLTERKDVFAFGSVRMARLATEKGWEPGSFFGGNHDYEIYSKYYKDNLLNYECSLKDISDELDWGINEIKFIRPAKDNKIFNGKLYTKIKWEDTLENIKERLIDLPSCVIQINKKMDIYKEARCWIVGGKVITSSYYKFLSNVNYSEYLEEDGLEFAQSMVDIYSVADGFVMDICLTPDGWKIVEINCLNCSGFYKGDMQKLLISLEDFYNPA